MADDTLGTLTLGKDPQDAFGRESILMILIFVLILGMGIDLGFQWRDKEPPPTKESFANSYVPGCVLTASTFTFPDGATLSGDFAKCGDQSKTFTPAISVVTIPRKQTVTVHTIIESDGKTTYPVVSVFTPASADVPTQEEMASGAAANFAKQVNVVDVTAPGVVASTSSTGEPLHVYAVIQRGYLMTLFTKGTGFSYDQGTLTYTPPQNLAKQ